MKPILKTSIILAVTLALISCEQISTDFPNISIDSSVINDVSFCSGIDGHTVVLTLDDARIVADKYLLRRHLTKSNDKTIKEIIPIYSTADTPVMYAVNFDEGFIWISARTDYYPILAEVEMGTFCPDSLDNGVGILLDELKEDIDYAATHEDSTDYYNSWQPYMQRVNTLTRSYNPSWDKDQQYAHYLLTTRLEDEEYDYDFLMCCDRLKLPKDIYDQFYANAEAYSFGNEDIRDLSVVAKKHVINEKYHGPYLNTQWHQSRPFSDATEDPSKPLGCVTVAVGQVMKYFEHPAYIDWSSMSNVMATSASVTFLAQLKKDLKVDANGGTTINEAKRVFSEYGYNCKIINHDPSEVRISLQYERPVYMRGQNSNDVGHAWVCDGYNLCVEYDQYELYTYMYDYGGMSYLETGWERLYTHSYYEYHMNMGWGGSYNGWYYGDGVSKYPNYRKEIIISGTN